MEKWLVVSLLLCCYGFFKELRPSEPFLTEYLIGPKWMNLTNEEVYQNVYPVWTYSYLALLPLVFITTDYFRYKPVIVLEGFAYIATWGLLLWGQGVRQMQLMEFAYGVATSTEVAYYTYIYAKVPKEAYQKVTSYTRSAILIGRTGSGIFAQLLTEFGWMDYGSLNYFSFASVIVSLVFALLLPSVPSSVYFHRKAADTSAAAPSPEDVPSSINILEAEEGAGPGPSLSAWRVLWDDFLFSYRQPSVIKWSIWWALATCGNFQVGNYIQPLWEEKAPFGDQEIYNGAVEAVTTFMGALCAFSVSYIRLNWTLVGDLALFLISLLDACCLFVMGYGESIWGTYAGYLLFRASYQMMITIASYQVAKDIRADSYGLVFGINTFMALLAQTVLTLVAVEEVGFALNPSQQFVVYAVYFVVVASLYLTLGLRTLMDSRRAPLAKTGIWEEGPREAPPVGSTEAL